MKVNIPLLKEICEVAGAPGFEQRIREIVIREVTPLVDEVKIDSIGNVIAIKKGKDRNKVMLAAHMDEIGFMVKHVDDNGFIRFHPLGGFDPKTLTAQRVVIHGKEDFIGVMGSKPIHLMKPEERKKPLALTDFFIDTGLPAEKVKALVTVGDPITRERTLIEMGDCVNCKSLDNRVSVYILIEMLKELGETPHDTYAVFTVQEEIGVRGATVAALDLNPDFAFCIDTTIAFDVPGAKPEEKVTELGKGVGIKVMDSRVVPDYRMVRYMKQTADKHSVKWQPELLPAGGTDTSAMQLFGRSIAGAVSIPTRHIHQVIEMSHKQDIRDTIELLKACLTDLDTYNWDFR